MPTNWYMLFLAALIPMIVGFIYYNPKVMGSAWMKVNGFTEESLKSKGGNMALTFGLSYLLSVFLAFALTWITIHQTHIFSLLAPDVMESGSAAQNQFNQLMAQLGGSYRTFGHGAFHGVIFSIMFVLPIMATNAMFEHRGWKYIMVNWIYWLIVTSLMGGLLCATLVYPALS